MPFKQPGKENTEELHTFKNRFIQNKTCGVKEHRSDTVCSTTCTHLTSGTDRTARDVSATTSPHHPSDKRHDGRQTPPTNASSSRGDPGGSSHILVLKQPHHAKETCPAITVFSARRHLMLHTFALALFISRTESKNSFGKA